jgi:regulator of protease activity HflC (stomatin/prohibitin superfamily)
MIRYLIQILMWPFGLRFAPDNHVVPILRLGRFHRVQGPGFFWVIPFLEHTLAPIDTGARVMELVFNDVTSRDNIPFRFHLTVIFTFKPSFATKEEAAQLIRLSNKKLEMRLEALVRDYTSDGLRRLAAKFCADEMSKDSTRFTIQWNLSHYLNYSLDTIGLILAKKGGVLIQEIVADKKFKEAMVNLQQQNVETALHSIAI